MNIFKVMPPISLVIIILLILLLIAYYSYRRFTQNTYQRIFFSLSMVFLYTSFIVLVYSLHYYLYPLKAQGEVVDIVHRTQIQHSHFLFSPRIVYQTVDGDPVYFNSGATQTEEHLSYRKGQKLTVLYDRFLPADAEISSRKGWLPSLITSGVLLAMSLVFLAVSGAFKPLYFQLFSSGKKIKLVKSVLDEIGVTYELEELRDQLNLNLAETSVTDDQLLILLPNIPKLHQLVLSGTDINGSGLIDLSKHSHLIILDLSGTKISDDHLTTISTSKIKRLNLSKTGISNHGIKLLTRLGELEYLNLSQTAINDGCFEHLAKLTQLKTVVFSANDSLSEKEKRIFRNKTGIKIEENIMIK